MKESDKIRLLEKLSPEFKKEVDSYISEVIEETIREKIINNLKLNINEAGSFSTEAKYEIELLYEDELVSSYIVRIPQMRIQNEN